MKGLEIILIVLLFVPLVVGFTVYTLNNKKYSCKSGTCTKDSGGDFASKSDCQTYCKANFDPNCQGKDENECKN